MADRQDGGAAGGPRQIRTRGGARLPALGLGTWTMGEAGARRRHEVAALQLGFDLGMSLVDSAEMYASGGAEEVVGEALRGRADQVFVVTKVLPENASRQGTVQAAERSLKRLGIDCIDLYLLHWKGAHPLAETLEGFAQLVDEQKIRHYGVSNFEAEDMRTAERYPLGPGIVANQVKYHLGQRRIEDQLLPWCAANGVAAMAYSPLDQGRLKVRPALAQVARRHDTTPECVALAWTLRDPMVVSIPKAGREAHVRDNARAASLALTPEDLAALDRDYPPP
jgi:diketogulonate reductase-like aldo/keto reductase